jgi:hypothetical protein
MLTPAMHVVRRIRVSILCTVLLFTPAIRAAQPVPPQISDEAFWKLVTESSEPGGGFISENLVSNELGYPYVIEQLKAKIQPGGTYIGVGPEQNFTYIAALQPKMAFIIDIRRQNMIEHLLYKAMFELSSNREEFLSRLFARKSVTVDRNATIGELFAAFATSARDATVYAETLEAVKNLLVTRHQFTLTAEDQETLTHVYNEFAEFGPETRYAITNLYFVNGRTLVNPDTVPPNAQAINGAAVGLVLGMPFPSYAEVMKATDDNGRKWSYLATEESYKTVRELQQKNLIVPLVGDFAGPKAVRAVGQYLKDRSATVSVFYVSNVEQYLTPLPKLQSFYANVAELPLDASSTFIRSAQVVGPQPGLAQSSISSMQTVRDAVVEGRARTWSDILQLSNSQ